AQTHTTTRSQQARAAQPAPTRPRVPGAGLVPPQADSSATATRVSMPLAQSAVRTANQAAMPVEARFEEGLDVDAGPLWTNAIVEATQIVEWDGYAMHLSVETSRNNMYRAAVEILKDGKRLERSGLIGPPFEDADSARNFAFDWARQWVEREGEIEPEAATSAAEPGSSVASEAASEAGAQTTALSTTRSTNGVITRSAAGSVRLAPMQRFTASTPLRASVDPCDSSAERRVHVSRYRTHLG
ncbi:MAG: hypothetical protein V4793_14085, partial [Paraburkholderia tropica]